MAGDRAPACHLLPTPVIGPTTPDPVDDAPAGPPGAALPSPAPPAGPKSSYDEVPYSVGAYPQTRPDRLAVLARLFGMTPAHPSRCRVLELGCAAGGNLIPMALDAPDARF